MTATYLLDTNIISDLMRNPSGRVADSIATVGVSQICTSIIVVAELRYGIARIRSQRLATQLAAVLEGLDVLAFEAPADAIYGELRTWLEQSGGPIGQNDMLIAAHALASGRTLVTANERGFGRVDGLQVENWLI